MKIKFKKKNYVRNYKVFIIIRFLLHQNVVLKCFWLMFYYDWILLRVVKIGAYYVSFFMK